MKIVFISDIHGISKNLEHIDKKVSNADKLVVLGDLYLGGEDRVEVEKFLNKYKNKLICMKGNCDSLSDIYKSSFLIIPDISLLLVDDLNIYITHGDKYNIYNNNNKLSNSILVYGHEHIPYIEKDSNMIYINVGSISKPRDDNKETYMIYENRSFTIYDIEENIIDKIEV